MARARESSEDPKSSMGSLEERLGPAPWVSVVIATFNREELLRRLLLQLDDQTLDPTKYEVVAVDDGSNADMRERLRDVRVKYRLLIERQSNAGAAAARQRGVERARGRIVVVVDDDMEIGPTFLERHLAHHEDDRTVVLGRMRPDANLAEMPLFERFYARVLARKADAFASGAAAPRGRDLYTGNVSFPRSFFLTCGGFDPRFRALEDEELGIRLEEAGARFVFADDAETRHGSDWTSMKKWMDRAYRDGVFQTRVARKHPSHPDASPWRHFPELNPISRPFMALSLAAPRATSVLAGAAIRAAAAFDKVGLEPVALAGATFVYGIQYYRGVRKETGSVLDVAKEYREFRRGVTLLGQGEHGDASAFRELADGVREDHRMTRFYAEKYDDRVDTSPPEAVGPAGGALALASDAVTKIGVQIMIAYRVMRFFRATGNGLAARFMSRAIRHAFSSDIHWDAELEPGVVVVHGFGLAISYAARVRTGCILFQNVTLGFGPDADRARPGGAPLLEKNVHVGIGATLYGPIVVGEGTKIMAGCVLQKSVPARSIVEAPVPQVSSRAPARPPLSRV